MTAALWILGWLRKVPWQAWACVALAALVLAYGHWRYNAGQADVQARWDKQEAAYALQRAEAALAARATEQRHRAEYKAIADRFLKEQADAEQEHAAVVAGLRDRSIRVRDRFRCPASAGMPQAPADSGRTAEAGEGGLSVADAEVVLRAGADADAIARQLNALIEAVEAGRE